ncbi:MAG: hypothetical protein A2166_06675 [Omnitrophica WOR_2 bacterium RBG_13_41_10]|nr:MAG: hypothetical protein A2166_06675 [Omnitrophica WOR_2 bacterium RBG_13_41_10]
MKIISNIFLFLNCAYLIFCGYVTKQLLALYYSFKVRIPITSIICFSILAIIGITTIIKEKIADKKKVMILNVSIFVFLIIAGTYLLVIGCFLPMQQITAGQ